MTDTVVTMAGWVDTQLSTWITELGEYLAAMRDYSAMDLAEVMESLAGFYSRAAEIRHQVVMGGSRQAEAFRTRQLDPFLEACDNQWKVFSRIAAIREVELKLTGDKRIT